MESLPHELVRTIRDYVYCFNWRTCKKKEASLIQTFRNTVHDAIWIRDTDEWTLFGLWFLIYLPREQHIAHRRPLIPPQEKYYRDNYKGWYVHRIQWING